MSAALCCQCASFSYDSGVLAVRDATLAIDGGQLWALLGPNGAGKSTLIRGLAGLVTARTGSVWLGPRPLGSLSIRERARAIAWLAQQDIVPEGITVAQFVALGRAPYTRWHGALTHEDRAAVRASIAWAKLEALADRPVSELSGGERRRAALARVHAQRASVLLLDEPTAFLDPKQQWWVLDAIARMVAQDACAAVMVLHDPAMALRFATHAALMREGQIVRAGSVREVVTSDALSEVFDMDSRVGRDPDTGLAYVVTVAARER
jgi:iron complex transport system ATP-binding protein